MAIDHPKDSKTTILSHGMDEQLKIEVGEVESIEIWTGLQWVVEPFDP